MNLRVGLDAQYLLPKRGAGSALADFVSSARAAGLDHLSLGDHVNFNGGKGFDGMINAMAILASAPELAVHIGVYLLPLRHPMLVARQISTIAEHAPGRLRIAFGVGGEDRNEFWSCGVDPSTRGERADEAFDVLRQLLTGEEIEHDGQFFSFESGQILPPPADPVPLLVGGRSEAALRRAGRVGDGWHGIWVDADRFAASLATVGEAAAEFDRDILPDDHAMTFWTGFDHAGVSGRDRVSRVMESFYGLPYDKFDRYCPTGSPEHVAEEIAPYVERGCRSVTLVAPDLPTEVALERTAEVRDLLKSPCDP